MNYILIKNVIDILKQLPFDAKRKVAINYLERLLRVLAGEVLPNPTKEEIKTTFDVVKELRQNSARSEREYYAIEEYIEHQKNNVELLYNQ